VRPALQEIADLVRREIGLMLRDNQETALEAAIRRSGVPDPQTFLRLAEDPLAGRAAIDRLIDHVTVQETYFLRERGQLESIAWRLLLQVAHEAGASTIRVWVAACATGEEAYTLAMLASEAFAPAAPPVDILATDISHAALEHAERGRYRPRSVQQLPTHLRSRWLLPTGDGEFEVDDRLRDLVRFRRHNLVRDAVPPIGEDRFDFVVCRNVLIYFDTPTVEKVIGSLESAVRPAGTLLLGAADTLCGSATRLAAAGAPPQAARAKRSAESPTLRRPLGREEDLLDQALLAADASRWTDALAIVARLLREEPLNADAYFVRGLVELEQGESDAAIHSFRRALYVDPAFGLAAFKLGRAYDVAGDLVAARRAYEQALRSLTPEEGRHERTLAQVDLGDVAAACRSRLAHLA
jgi:chemotaxis protein methyltransferase CheR